MYPSVFDSPQAAGSPNQQPQEQIQQAQPLDDFADFFGSEPEPAPQRPASAGPVCYLYRFYVVFMLCVCCFMLFSCVFNGVLLFLFDI
jgi:hypothetical protein